MKVLVVESRRRVGQSVQDVLRGDARENFEVVVASTLAESLEQAEKELFDVVLLDLMLPDAMGVEAVRRFVKGAPTLPVVILTDPDDGGTVLESFRYGAQDFVSQDDLEPGRLARTLRYAVERERLFRNLAEVTRRLAQELDEREKAEVRLRNSVRALRTLAACSRAVRESNGEDDLLETFCRIAVEEGGYRMVWVGEKGDGEGKPLLPVAVAGHHAGYLEAVRMTWEDSVPGRGPSGTAARTGQPSIVRRIDADPRFDPWRREALARGYRSVLALPLRVGQNVLGVFVVYSGDPNAFDDDEIHLLDRVSELLSNGLRTRRLAGALVEAEDRLRQSEKLSAVGQLAGGVAHDFNNLLQIILVQTEILLTSPGLPTASRQRLEDVLEAAERAADLTRQLLAFSRRQVLQPRVVELNAVVQGVTKMLERVLGEDVLMEIRLESNPWCVLVDPGQIEQVLLNLAINARDAMAGGGVLTVETKNVDLDETYSEVHGGLVPAGSYVMMALSDTGIGMDLKTRARIFEPFFTTKEKGKGTGLGLATVYGIVKQSGGYIWVYSEPGKGTSFKIYFPKSESAATKKVVGSKATAPGVGTVLLVEDDPRVRASVKDALQRIGYQVLEAQGPGEALFLAGEYREKIDLLLTDVVMPHMNGPELARRIRETIPQIRLLFMTGYTESAIVHQEVMKAKVPLIHKPFSHDDLAGKVLAVLRGE